MQSQDCSSEPAQSRKLVKPTDHVHITFLIPGCSAMQVLPRRFIYNHLPSTGLIPVRLNRRRGTFSAMKSYTVGAMADSYYEYLLKMWLLKGQQVCNPHLPCSQRAAGACLQSGRSWFGPA